MPPSYNNTIKGSLAGVVIAAVDGGSGAGTLEICSAAYAAVLATITLSDPCGTQVNGLITFSGFPKEAAVSTPGTAAVARIKDSAGTVCFDGLTVGTAATDITLGTVTLIAGNTVRITSATLQVQ